MKCDSRYSGVVLQGCPITRCFGDSATGHGVTYHSAVSISTLLLALIAIFVVVAMMVELTTFVTPLVLRRLLAPRVPDIRLGWTLRLEIKDVALRQASTATGN